MVDMKTQEPIGAEDAKDGDLGEKAQSNTQASDKQGVAGVAAGVGNAHSKAGVQGSSHTSAEDNFEALDDEDIPFDVDDDTDEQATTPGEDGSVANSTSDDNGLDAARKEASDWQDRYLRLHAEWDTYRRRMGEQREEERKRANEKLMSGLLPVLDDFERSIAYASENGEAGLLEGVQAVQTKLLSVLTQSGLELIDPAGEAYNALEAQAVATIPDESVYDETVKEVYQKGFKLGNKVLRAAMVTVTTGGPARPKEDIADSK